MNLFNIIDEIQKVDPEFQDRISPRRDAIKNITSFGSKVAVAAMPFALGTLFKKAYGGVPTSQVIDVLNFALTLEYLESSFYNKGAASGGLILDSAYISQIQADENAHVKFLQTAISGAGGTPTPESSFTFDFTGGGTMAGPTNTGPFADVFTNYQTFLAVAETFEDTGVRAYKGQAPNLLLNAVLTYALDIHAVEARHASAIRYLRMTRGYDTINPWITSTSKGNDTNIGTAVDGNYEGEQNTMQLTIDVTTLPSATGSTTSVATATAAFDEPLTEDAIKSILIPHFIQSA